MTDLGDVSPLSSLLQPLIDMIEEPSLRDLAQETARIYYQGDNGVTINLIPSVIIGLLLLLGLLKLAGLPILASFGLGGGTGTGAAGGSGYGAPSAGYGAPDAGYGAPSDGYGAPSYDSYARSAEYDSTIAGLQEQINQLAASNEALTSQVYYSGASTANTGSLATNLLASS